MLTISRPDIDRNAITEFPLSERFIKLPIVGYLKLLGIYDTMNRPQYALINAVNSPKYRFICAALARRLGKTYIANVIGQLVALVPGCNILIMSPNYNLSSISFELQRKLISHFDLEVDKNNLKDRVIELSNGSTIRMGSLSTVDSCVGRSYDLIIFDEAALGADGMEAFNISLRPTLDKPNSKAIFISTPRGKNNWFSVLFQRGFSDEYPEWASLTADYSENDRMKESDVEEARRSMSRAEFEQEYMASFSTFEGQIYSGFDSDTQVIDYVPGDRHEPFAGLDPGYKDPTALVCVVYDPDKMHYHVVDEYQDSQAVTSAHAERFKEYIAKWGLDPIFIDPAAAQFAADLAYIYDIPTIKGKKAINEGIAFLQTIVEQGRLFVSPHCTLTLRMLDQYRWKMDVQSGIEKPDHTDESHIADALRYAIYTFTV